MVIESADLTTERCFSVSIGLKGNGGSVVFGGYCLDGWDAAKKRRVGSAFGCDFIMRVLHVVGVENWNQLKGKPVRAKFDGGGMGRIVAIGHFMEDRWLDPKAFAAEHGLKD